MTRALRDRLLVVGAAIALSACGDVGPSLDFTFQKTASVTVGVLGTDSTGVLAVDSAIYLIGVMYAIASCDEFQAQGERGGGNLSIAITAYTSQQCLPLQLRLSYTVTIRGLAPGAYNVELLHREPNSPARGTRRVFTGSVQVR